MLAGQDVPDGFIALPPCIPVDDLANPAMPWQQAGRPCPFVALSPANQPAAEAVTYTLNDLTRDMAALFAQSVADTLDVLERQAFFSRILAALDYSSDVRKRRHPRQEVSSG